VAALQLQNETLVAQQRAEIAAVRSDCEARKQRWKSEVHKLRPKIHSLQTEMQTKGESTRDDDRRTPADLSLINRFSDAIQSELLRQRRLYSLTSSVPSAELPIKQCYLGLVQTFNEITEHFSLQLAAAGKQSSSAECGDVVEASAGANEIVRGKLREMKKEKSALIAKLHDTSEPFRELELKLSHEQKLVAGYRAAILEQQQIIYDLEYRIQGLAASNEEFDVALMSQKKKRKVFSIPKSQNWTESSSNRQTAA
jgi:hypothetical protein